MVREGLGAWPLLFLLPLASCGSVVRSASWGGKLGVVGLVHSPPLHHFGKEGADVWLDVEDWARQVQVLCTFEAGGRPVGKKEVLLDCWTWDSLIPVPV